ncbi:MAG: hypothetical protein V8R16_06585 [Bacilli bacterium]
MNKKLKLGLLSTLLLVGCNVVTPPSSSSNTPSNGEFDYEDPKTNIVSESSHSSSSSSTSTRKDNYGDLDIEVLTTVNDNGTFIAEAEDCDTKGCTLQADCAGFIESTSFASGNMCIACISAPSILAFSFDLESSCDIEFITVSAKYENPWNLDQNVSYYVDKDGNNFVHTLSSNGYTDFGHTNENQWYNFKNVSLGKLSLTRGTHTMYIQVKGAFPNTDCFKLIATNFDK